MTEWRTAGPILRALSVAAGLLSVLPPVRLSAQVGHDPAASPYHDVGRGAGPSAFVGYLGGDRGKAGVGPSDALTFGARYDLPLGRAVLLQFGASYLQGDRFIVDPAAHDTAPARRTGPAETSLLLTDVGLQLRLSGGKAWHGLAPYIGAGAGLAFDVQSPGDSTGSGYRFGTKVAFSGVAGTRWHLGRRVTVQADVRALMWRLRYPSSFHAAPPGGGTRVIPLEDPLTDWTLHPWVSLGVGWTF